MRDDRRGARDTAHAASRRRADSGRDTLSRDDGEMLRRARRLDAGTGPSAPPAAPAGEEYVVGLRRARAGRGSPPAHRAIPPTLPPVPEPRRA